MMFPTTASGLMGLIALAHTGACLTAPSTLSAFTSVLSQAKLQYPDDDQVASSTELLAGYVATYFQVVDTNYVQFSVAGDSGRCELREMDSDSVKSAFSIDDDLTYTSTATISVPDQETGIEEVTIMQLHGTTAPAVRISWRSEITIDDVDYTDVIVSTIRTDIDNKLYSKEVLLDHTTADVDYTLTAVGSLIYISVDGTQIVSGTSISTFSGYDMYFKAGAYNNNPTDTTATAYAKFSALDW